MENSSGFLIYEYCTVLVLYSYKSTCRHEAQAGKNVGCRAVDSYSYRTRSRTVRVLVGDGIASLFEFQYEYSTIPVPGTTKRPKVYNVQTTVHLYTVHLYILTYNCSKKMETPTLSMARRSFIFIVSLFAFGWTYARGAVEPTLVERLGLRDFYAATGGSTSWTRKWDTTTEPCEGGWYGVVCDARGHIVEFQLVSLSRCTTFLLLQPKASLTFIQHCLASLSPTTSCTGRSQLRSQIPFHTCASLTCPVIC